MKRIISICFCAVMIVLMSVSVNAAFESELSGELSGIEPGSVKDFLDENGVDTSSPETIKNLGAGAILNYFLSTFRSALSRPLKMLVVIVAIGIIAQFAGTMAARARLGADAFVMICFLSISPFIISSFSAMVSAAESQQAFMYSYIPIFAGITAASGNISGAASYNALILYSSEIIASIATTVLKPILCCMLVLACAQALNTGLPDFTGALKRVLIGIIGTVMTVFVGVIGLQTATGRAGSELALKAGKYLVSSFVPIIGYSLSESYKTVRISLGAIRASVGALGIVIVIIILSMPIITMIVYKQIIIISEWLCRLMGSEMLANLLKGIADVYSLCITVLLVYALVFTLSTGMIIMMGSEAL